MSVALRLYEQLTEAPDDKTKARLIAEAFEQIEERYPYLKEAATQSHLRETELRLQKEIEQIRLEIKAVEASLRKEIERTRLEIKEVEASLRKEIEHTRLEIKEVEASLHKEIEQTRLEIKEVEAKLSMEIKNVDTALRLEIKNVEIKVAESRADLIRWVVAVGVLQTTLLTGVLLKVAHLI